MVEAQRLNWLDKLNPQQREAVTYGEGPLLIVAGAGTGKTMTLAFRVSYLIHRGVRPDRILLLTFTRRASEEMLRRASAVTPNNIAASSRVWGGTFHAISNRLLRIYAQSAGLSPDFTILDRGDAEDVIDLVRNELSFSRTDARFPRKGTCMDIYSRRVNGEEDLQTVLKKYFPWCEMWKDELNRLFRSYALRKQQRDILDYDDLLLYWYHLLQDANVADAIGGRFEHILVDEYQDTNRLQAGILQGMRQQIKNLTVVGDDAQSIYGFRSATVRNMLDFPGLFPGSKVVTLEQNYRSVQPVLETTNRLVAQARERYSKELWSNRKSGQLPVLVSCRDENEQDEAVIRRVLEHREQGIALRKQAVLFRASHHSASLELALARKNIPFHKYGGLRFLEATHIKDVLSILRIVLNPKDETAWFRVLQLLDGVGPAIASAAFQHVQQNGPDPASLVGFRSNAGVRQGIEALASLLGDLSLTKNEGPSLQIDRILKFYLPLLEKNYDNPLPRANDIEHLARLATGCASTEQFLADLVLDPPASTGDFAGPPTKDDDWLVLSTVHSAKGLEWDVVFLIHAADGCIPSDMSTGSETEIEEELRMAYVAMTRARDFLYVLWPLRYYQKPGNMTDRHSYAQRSRFLTEDVVATMERVADASARDPSKPAEQGDPVRRIGDRILDMWG